jgi:hypothetical protein
MTELQVLPINKSVLFLEDRNFIITRDAWRVVIDLDTQVYEDAIATVRNDVTSVDKGKNLNLLQN